MIAALDPLAPYLFAAIIAWFAGLTLRRAILKARRWRQRERTAAQLAASRKIRSGLKKDGPQEGRESTISKGARVRYGEKL